MEPEVIQRAAAQLPTPFYLLNLDVFHRRLERTNQILGEGRELVYAMKANPFLAAAAAEKGYRLEVCSPGEFAICEREGISMRQIVLSGVYKEEKEIRRVIQKYPGQGVYTVESLAQLEFLDKAGGQLEDPVPVLLRLTSGNQFGLEEAVIREIVRERERYTGIRILGLQFYSGTQKRKREVLEQELSRLDKLLTDLKEEYDFLTEELEYGPGLFVPYFQKEDPKEGEELLKALRVCLDHLDFKGKIILEMGRFLAWDCGCYLTTVVDVKEREDIPYAIVDGGIHHLNYYGQTMAMKIPRFTQLAGDTLAVRAKKYTKEIHVCGALCTSADVLVRKMPLIGETIKDLLGDILVFENTGAYSITEGLYLFLSRDLPAVVAWSEKQGLELTREGLETNKLNSRSFEEETLWNN